MSYCRILVWEWGQRWQQPLGKRFISLIPSCRSSGGASSSSVLEGRWDSAGDGPQGQCCPGHLEAQPDPLQHDPWLKGGGNSAISYVVEMHLLLYILGKSFYQQYTTRSVFCQVAWRMPSGLGLWGTVKERSCVFWFRYIHSTHELAIHPCEARRMEVCGSSRFKSHMDN